MVRHDGASTAPDSPGLEGDVSQGFDRFEDTDEDEIVEAALTALLEVRRDDDLADAAREALAAIAQAAVAIKQDRLAHAPIQPRCAPALPRQRIDAAARAAVRPREARGEPRDGETEGRLQGQGVGLAARASHQRPAESSRNRTVSRGQSQPHHPSARERNGRLREPCATGIRSVQHPPAKPGPLTGADLASWRNGLGLTQVGAAEKLGVRQGTISKAESRPARPVGPKLQEALENRIRTDPRRP